MKLNSCKIDLKIKLKSPNRKLEKEKGIKIEKKDNSLPGDGLPAWPRIQPAQILFREKKKKFFSSSRR
jgi:hypothetical protein